jgi:hypothetical protein
MGPDVVTVRPAWFEGPDMDVSNTGALGAICRAVLLWPGFCSRPHILFLY